MPRVKKGVVRYCRPIASPFVDFTFVPKRNLIQKQLKAPRRPPYIGKKGRAFVLFFLVSKREMVSHPIQLSLDAALQLAPSKARGLRLAISCAGKATSTFYVQLPTTAQKTPNMNAGSRLTLNQTLWSQSAQKLIGEHELIEQINEHLLAIKATLLAIWEQQQEQADRGLADQPTPDDIRTAFLTSSAHVTATYIPDPLSVTSSITDAYAHFIRLLAARSPKACRATITSWDYTAECIQEYIATTRMIVPSYSAITLGWAKRYHSWLCHRTRLRKSGIPYRPMCVTSATRHVLKLRSVLTFLVEDGLLERNVLETIRLAKSEPKETWFLEEEHLRALLALDQPQSSYGTALWWIKLMCLTGFDYSDAVRYIANRDQYEQQTALGSKIVIKRSKKPYKECTVYMLADLVELLVKQPLVLHPLTARKINDYMRINKVIDQIGFAFPLTCKIGRKTAGNYFLRKGFSVTGISGILGHLRIATTETHYIKVTGGFIDNEVSRLVSNGRLAGQLETPLALE